MRESADDADIAVVGAGPAGSWAARQLAAGGARVLVFDASHPREKPCGGGITGRALEEIQAAVPADSLAGVSVDSAHFRTNAQAATVSLRGGPRTHRRLVIVDRRSFDSALLSAAVAAGAEHIAERVVDAETASDGIVLRTARRRYRCGRVVGADGANSLVRRRVARPFPREDLSVATGFYAYGPAAPDIHVDFVPDPPGYFWSFPRHDHLAVGMCAPAGAARVGSLEALVRDRLPSLVPVGSRLVRYSWPIPSLRRETLAAECPAGDRWLLVGDAAGLVDPITREGIFFALRSASLAAEALLGPEGASRRFTDAVRSEIHSELARAARLRRGFFAGPFTRLLVEALQQSGPVRDVMADLVAGVQPYRTLKRRLLATLEVRLAWRLLVLEASGSGGRSAALRQRTT